MLEHRRNAAGGGLTLTPGDSRRQGTQVPWSVKNTLVDEADDLELYALAHRQPLCMCSMGVAWSTLRAPLQRRGRWFSPDSPKPDSPNLEKYIV